MDHPQHETRQTALFETSRDLLRQNSPEAVAELAVEAAREILELPINGIYLVDDEVLRPVVISDAVSARVVDPPVFRAGDSLAWQVFETGEPRSHNGICVVETDGTTDTGVRSELGVPLGDHGVFLAGSATPNAFDDYAVSQTELLMGSVETALDHLDRERHLRAQQDRLDAFIGNISHDLRSPLAVAKAGVEVARRTSTTESLDRVDRAHGRIQTLLDDLLTLAREGTALEDADLDAVDLSRVATDAWTAIETTDADAEVAVDAAETVVASRSRLQQLLENLFRNSVEHGSTGSRATPGDSVEHGSTSSRPPADDNVERGSMSDRPSTKGAAVRIRVGPLGDGFYIEDDGPGIDAADRREVFETGYSTRDDGTGLGLRIVRTIVDAHGWDVAVTDADDGGARFEITGVERATDDRAGKQV